MSKESENTNWMGDDVPFKYVLVYTGDISSPDKVAILYVRPFSLLHIETKQFCEFAMKADGTIYGRGTAAKMLQELVRQGQGSTQAIIELTNPMSARGPEMSALDIMLGAGLDEDDLNQMQETNKFLVVPSSCVISIPADGTVVQV